MSGSVCNCVAVETVVPNSLCENTNVSHARDDASRSFVKRINVRASSWFVSLIVKRTARRKKIRRIGLSVVNMTLVTEVIKSLPRRSQNQGRPWSPAGFAA